MTRDTIRVHDDREPAEDTELYAALWDVDSFPRVPDDAPIELKNLAIDIDDPKRVYAIYKASRRHNFQLLVERYTQQVRYGCQFKACNTATCFSCRKRLAAGAPVRRYNATGARSLAIYLASQDNPETGLCHHSSARPKSGVIKHAYSRSLPTTDAQNSPIGLDLRRQSGSKDIVHGNNGHENNGPQASIVKKAAGSDGASRTDTVDVSILDEPTTMDHRSFVQNVFGTVAFKMMEWLTPGNFELLEKSRSEQGRTVSPPEPEFQKEEHISQKEFVGGSITENKEKDALSAPSPKPKNQNHHRPKSSNMQPLIEATSMEFPKAKPVTAHETTSQSSLESRSASKTQNQRPDEMPRRRTGSLDSHGPRNILNKLPKPSESIGDLNGLTSRPLGALPPKQRLSKQNLVTSPTMLVAENPPLQGLVSVSAQNTDKSEYLAKPIEEEEEEKKDVIPKDIAQDLALSRKESNSTTSSPVKSHSLPQSLPSLPIEIVELLCDIMQTDGSSEMHFLVPSSIDTELKRQKPNSQVLSRIPSLQSSARPSNKKQWRKFVEQCFFDVLSRPESLLESFSDKEGKLLDTQTIWYLLLRMTRVAPSLVFDCLWNNLGKLFRPPNHLVETLDWANQSPAIKKPPYISNLDAAKIINICLHALVAAIPLVSDPRMVANMSRIRSYGVTTLRRETSPLATLSLSLQYEDAFSNELTLRLARRLFAAIPIRRRFVELTGFATRDDQYAPEREDILESILKTLRFLDLGTPPILNFPDSERELHEKRVPTLILDWARTVMLQDWQGSAVVPSDGSFGGALATMAAIHKNRKSLLLGDIHFRTEYFDERLDSVGMPIEWLSYIPNRKTFHLLNHPYLFHPSTLVTYFRAINYSRMNQSYEEAKSAGGIIYTINRDSLMPEQSQKDKIYARLRTATSRFMVLEISRENVLTDTFNSIWRREERELLRPLKVRLGEAGGEEGLDSGGVQQEFFRLAIAEALNPDYGTFTVDPRTKMTWFQPGSPEPLWKFELIGMIISLAVYNGDTLPVTFPKALYRKLLDEEVTELHHIADGWPDLSNGLTTLLEWDEKDGLVEDIFARTYEFSVEQFGQPVSRDMFEGSKWPQFSDATTSANPEDAPMVTNENRNSYVSDYIHWLTDVSIEPQYQAFKKGFFSCINRQSLTLFTATTLQSLIEGIQEIDIAELRSSCRYIGWDASHRSIRDFWSIVKRYSLEDKKKLLEFVTASDRVPVGGMRNLQFTIQRNGVDDGHLPSSYTCYGILLLPEYSSKEVLRAKLGMALENSRGFGFA